MRNTQQPESSTHREVQLKSLSNPWWTPLVLVPANPIITRDRLRGSTRENLLGTYFPIASCILATFPSHGEFVELETDIPITQNGKVVYPGTKISIPKMSRVIIGIGGGVGKIRYLVTVH